MSTTTQEQLIQDIVDRAVASVGESLDQRVIDAIKASLPDIMQDDPEFARKMQFSEGDKRLVGTKFSRWKLNVGDIELLYDIQSSLKGQKRVDEGFHDGPSEELTKAFRDISDAYYLSDAEAKAIDKQAIDNVYGRLPKQSRDAWREGAYRAMDTAESGYGSQLVGAQYVGDLWEAARPESRIASLLETFEMTAPTAYLPVEVDIPQFMLAPESTANNSSNYGTVKTGSNRVSVTAKKFLMHQMWSGEMDEDSIIPFLPFLRRQAALGQAHYLDAAILNGDTTDAGTGNINQDDEDPGGTEYFLAWDGLRHVGLVDNTANSVNVGAGIGFNNLRDARGLMLDTANIHDWGHPSNMDDLVYLADPETADRIATLDEIINAKTVNGSNANLLTGEVARIIGHPVIATMAMKKTEADGKLSYDTPANNVYGQVVAFNRRGYTLGWRRRVKVEVERIPATDQTRIVYSMRAGLGRFTPTGNVSGIESAVTLYNISL